MGQDTKETFGSACGAAPAENGGAALHADFSEWDGYGLDRYRSDIAAHGLKATWDAITAYLLSGRARGSFLQPDRLAELYEIGLAMEDKQSKKSSGQYYTPDDVAAVMAEWLEGQPGTNVCDVGCGTGKLISAYLDRLGRERAAALIRSGRVYLYDVDGIALQICKTILLLRYGRELEPFLHIDRRDFLARDTVLPDDCKVIANPPYANVGELLPAWEETQVVADTRELYAMFFEKIVRQSRSCVVITPYSFLGGNKFYALRECLNERSGFIVSFDNVPGNIFRGKKHGVFNSNTVNSVRAAITVAERGTERRGFRISPLIRFKNEEREALLQTEVLESFLGSEYQTVSKENPMYCKCHRELSAVYRAWKALGSGQLGDLVSEQGEYVLSMPNTCRYFTVASCGRMNRSGQIVLSFADRAVFEYVYCLINSSFAYWYWRMFDGGITYPKNLLLGMPVFYAALTDDDRRFFHEIASKMIDGAEKYIVTKNNVGIQENIKYPREFRDEIDRRLLRILGCKQDARLFDAVHSNMALAERPSGGLTRAQREIMGEFYGKPARKAVFRKRERTALWNAAKRHDPLDFGGIRTACPSLAHRIERSYESGRNIQSAVFSECAYAQTLAELFGLDVFELYGQGGQISAEIVSLLDSHGLKPRYVYTNAARSRLLIQAGGCGGIDGALIEVATREIRTIEFKEPGSKSTEADLPKYGEDGLLRVTDEFLAKYPQFSAMLAEQRGLNFFEKMGSNEKNFSTASTDAAVTHNYDGAGKKQADVVCTEDREGYLVMLPVQDLAEWATTRGEIRPAGRNFSEVFTPLALAEFLRKKGGEIAEGVVTFRRADLKVRRERGHGAPSGYKINSLFFVYSDRCTEEGDRVSFPVSAIRQLRPTIAGKLNFRALQYGKVRERYYGKDE